LEESGWPRSKDKPFNSIVLEEIDFALRPNVHERRVPSSGTIVEPTTHPRRWKSGTELSIKRVPLAPENIAGSRRFVDGLSSWLVRHADGSGEWVLFDRPAGSERDLVVMSHVINATVIQRHPAGVVRVAGDFGILRWEGLTWRHEPPVRSWMGVLANGHAPNGLNVVEAMLRFAVHDLGSTGIGALMVFRPLNEPGPTFEERLPAPPPLSILSAVHLAPLRHALSQTDGAAVFDGEGLLRHLGVRLIPSPKAERKVGALGGTRHTSGLRYSHDDPTAVVIAVSEDGPVSVLQNGEVLARPAV